MTGVDRRPSRRRTGASTAPIVAMCVLALGACSSDAPSLPDEPLPAAVAQGVPEPTGEVVLTVTVDGTSHDWDRAALELLEQQDLTVFEPFVEAEHTYTGPLFADVLRASGADLEASTTAQLVALDDFVADLTLDASTLDGLVLAHREDGGAIPVARGGPTRLVFPPDNPAGDNVNNWIWSIRTVSVG